MWLLCLGYAHDTSIVCGTSSGGASNLFFFSVEARWVLMAHMPVFHSWRMGGRMGPRR